MNRSSVLSRFSLLFYHRDCRQTKSQKKTAYKSKSWSNTGNPSLDSYYRRLELEIHDNFRLFLD